MSYYVAVCKTLRNHINFEVTINFADTVGWGGGRAKGEGWVEGRGSRRMFVTKELDSSVNFYVSTFS